MKILNYFYFTRSERNGAVLLLVISTIIYLIPELRYRMSEQAAPNAGIFVAEANRIRSLVADSGQHHEQASPVMLFNFDPNTASQEDFEALGLSEKTARTICHYRSKGGRFKTSADFKKIWGLSGSDYERLAGYIQIGGQTNTGSTTAAPSAQAFLFDPNTADESVLKNLNLPSRTIKSILNYRTKGGRFKSKTDFQKIYTLSESDFLRLEPYIQIADAVAAEQRTNQPASNPRKTTSVVVDINRASVEQWQSLPGIGETRARQIVNFRQKLGGFLNVAQVAETRYLPDSIFQRIRPHLMLESGNLRQININTVELETLVAHPYFSKKQATALIEYRKQHGPYRSVTDLSAVIILKDPTWLEKVKPYLGI